MQTALAGEYRRLSSAPAAPKSLAFLRLRRALRNTLAQGQLRGGASLPSERDLAKALAWSRVTVGKALAALLEDGLPVRKRGAGTLVAERIVKLIARLSGFAVIRPLGQQAGNVQARLNSLRVRSPQGASRPERG